MKTQTLACQVCQAQPKLVFPEAGNFLDFLFMCVAHSHGLRCSG